MSHSRWTRHSDEKLAIDVLLDAAGQTFAERGVADATMVDISRAAGCSRATLYRYFPNQEALHLAFVHRATLRIARRLAEERQGVPWASLTDRILAGIAAVRGDPLLAVWFRPENLSVPIRVSQNSDLLRTMSSGLIDETYPASQRSEETDQRGAWLLRCIISFLAMPGSDEAAERAMIESFVVPVLNSEQPLERVS